MGTKPRREGVVGRCGGIKPLEAWGVTVEVEMGGKRERERGRREGRDRQMRLGHTLQLIYLSKFDTRGKCLRACPIFREVNARCLLFLVTIVEILNRARIRRRLHSQKPGRANEHPQQEIKRRSHEIKSRGGCGVDQREWAMLLLFWCSAAPSFLLSFGPRRNLLLLSLLPAYCDRKRER